jgi:GDP-L-fucose synthase
VVGYDGELVWDKTKPDGTPRKLLDVTRIRSLGWQPTVPLLKGIAQTYAWFLANGPQK